MEAHRRGIVRIRGSQGRLTSVEKQKSVKISDWKKNQSVILEQKNEIFQGIGSTTVQTQERINELGKMAKETFKMK